MHAQPHSNLCIRLHVWGLVRTTASDFKEESGTLIKLEPLA